MSKTRRKKPLRHRDHMARIGAKGGKAGRGASKTRSREHYVLAALARWGKVTNNPAASE